MSLDDLGAMAAAEADGMIYDEERADAFRDYLFAKAHFKGDYKPEDFLPKRKQSEEESDELKQKRAMLTLRTLAARDAGIRHRAAKGNKEKNGQRKVNECQSDSFRLLNEVQ